MKIRPLHDRILVERLEEKEVKKGGIIIPDTAKEKPQEAKVIAVGNGKVTDEGKKIPLDVKAGDRILLSGTTATHRDRVIGGRDPAAQAALSSAQAKPQRLPSSPPPESARRARPVR